MDGMLFLVVGPSGAGKDTLLNGARYDLESEGKFLVARRVITRPEDAGDENHEAVDEVEFERRITLKHFFCHWSAHGLRYGLPVTLLDELKTGRHVIANVSRSIIEDITNTYLKTRILAITAPNDILAKRLTARGREGNKDIEQRLIRRGRSYNPNFEVLTIKNDTSPEEGIQRFIRTVRHATMERLKIHLLPIDTWHENICFLHRRCRKYKAMDYLGAGKVDISTINTSIRAKVNVVDDAELVAPDQIGLSRHSFEQLGAAENSTVVIERTPSPKSIRALRSKLGGKELSLDEMHTVIRDIVQDRYTDKEIAAFLVTLTRDLTLTEIQSLTIARAEFAHRFNWGESLVVDKHSMGGIPGSRITMIIIPIVAAHGLLIPKTSSRAITSAAGTADAMETMARVDLKPAEVRHVVGSANGCIAWNGRLNHSTVDDVMNAITRPLGIDSTKWSVASILSKKLAAGATHTIIDIPVGPDAKVHTGREGRELSRLFQDVGKGVGMKVIARVTDGTRPIGRGIGPALEARDTFKVLRNQTDAPLDLKEKALGFAASIIEWDPNISPGQGRKIASDILSSGRALSAMEKIIDLQGRWEKPTLPGSLVYELKATHSGIVTGINSKQISGIARGAGAPMDKGSGIDLLVQQGEEVKLGEPMYLIFANTEADHRLAIERSLYDNGIEIE